ncbi:nuclear transport factor 2 family protein [Kibdelosporangium phytohabitans]|uniref:SnoaL-like domain-containing protein n=1 Tax=Kibdelosporangium phytohabitans TaxID=860235 RepID=A0A0N9HRF6_9PSEU|nr:nuclear transport factor 2 family protein [Kibdelosporangium phytohabitans]ALG07416.1 hypothetical protein AOZ06_11225 [Kibdelosporangium phytohabitans]MBE1471696.1 ketosteroid isomerase-like protein [Kibdelosporangium phytohabitans]
MEKRLSRATVVRAGAAGLAATVLAAPAASATGGEHPNVALIRRYYQVYGSGDLTALRQFFAPGIRWTIPGHHPLAGTKNGPDEVLAFFAQLAKSGFRAEILFLAADGDWVVDMHRGWSTTPTGLDITWTLAYRIRGRQIVEAVNFAADQHAADAFFWRQYPLAPIPRRLA